MNLGRNLMMSMYDHLCIERQSSIWLAREYLQSHRCRSQTGRDEGTLGLPSWKLDTNWYCRMGPLNRSHPSFFTLSFAFWGKTVILQDGSGSDRLPLSLCWRRWQRPARSDPRVTTWPAQPPIYAHFFNLLVNEVEFDRKHISPTRSPAHPPIHSHFFFRFCNCWSC